MMPGKFGFLVQVGSGQQYMPWIHIKDLCNIYLRAIQDPTMTGPYNAVAPQHVTHKEFIKTLAGVMRLPVFPVHIPGFVLKTVLGEMSDVVLKGSRVSSEKITAEGYMFEYRKLEAALENVVSEGKQKPLPVS
jgi:NAD dependent epimerase/dehydratase family enzyme